MGSSLPAMLLDGAVLVLLGVTIVYVYRLTRSLEAFRRHREAMDSVMANLLSGIAQAEDSVKTLKSASAEEAGVLEKLIAQARTLSDELTIINESGENIAKRIEAQAARVNAPEKTVPVQKAAAPKPSDAGARPAKSVRRRSRPQAKTGAYDSTLRRIDREASAPGEEDLPSFMVRDRDFEEETHALSSDEANVPPLRSQAEQDLYDALRGRKSKGAGRKR